MFLCIRNLLEGEESRLNVSRAAPATVYSQALYCTPSYGRTQLSAVSPFLLSSRLFSSTLSTEDRISASQAQQAEASPPQEEEEEQGEEEEDEKEEEVVEDEAEEAGGEGIPCNILSLQVFFLCILNTNITKMFVFFWFWKRRG